MNTESKSPPSSYPLIPLEELQLFDTEFLERSQLQAKSLFRALASSTQTDHTIWDEEIQVDDEIKHLSMQLKRQIAIVSDELSRRLALARVQALLNNDDDTAKRLKNMEYMTISADEKVRIQTNENTYLSSFLPTIEKMAQPVVSRTTSTICSTPKSCIQGLPAMRPTDKTNFVNVTTVHKPFDSQTDSSSNDQLHSNPTSARLIGQGHNTSTLCEATSQNKRHSTSQRSSTRKKTREMPRSRCQSNKSRARSTTATNRTIPFGEEFLISSGHPRRLNWGKNTKRCKKSTTSDNSGPTMLKKQNSSSAITRFRSKNSLRRKNSEGNILTANKAKEGNNPRRIPSATSYISSHTSTGSHSNFTQRANNKKTSITSDKVKTKQSNITVASVDSGETSLSANKTQEESGITRKAPSVTSFSFDVASDTESNLNFTQKSKNKEISAVTQKDNTKQAYNTSASLTVRTSFRMSIPSTDECNYSISDPVCMMSATTPNVSYTVVSVAKSDSPDTGHVSSNESSESSTTIVTETTGRLCEESTKVTNSPTMGSHISRIRTPTSVATRATSPTLSTAIPDDLASSPHSSIYVDATQNLVHATTITYTIPVTKSTSLTSDLNTVETTSDESHISSNNAIPVCSLKYVQTLSECQGCSSDNTQVSTKPSYQTVICDSIEPTQSHQNDGTISLNGELVDPRRMNQETENAFFYAESTVSTPTTVKQSYKHKDANSERLYEESVKQYELPAISKTSTDRNTGNPSVDFQLAAKTTSTSSQVERLNDFPPISNAHDMTDQDSKQDSVKHKLKPAIDMETSLNVSRGVRALDVTQDYQAMNRSIQNNERPLKYVDDVLVSGCPPIPSHSFSSTSSTGQALCISEVQKSNDEQQDNSSVASQYSHHSHVSRIPCLQTTSQVRKQDNQNSEKWRQHEQPHHPSCPHPESQSDMQSTSHDSISMSLSLTYTTTKESISSAFSNQSLDQRLVQVPSTAPDKNINNFEVCTTKPIIHADTTPKSQLKFVPIFTEFKQIFVACQPGWNWLGRVAAGGMSTTMAKINRGSSRVDNVKDNQSNHIKKKFLPVEIIARHWISIVQNLLDHINHSESGGKRFHHSDSTNPILNNKHEKEIDRRNDHDRPNKDTVSNGTASQEYFSQSESNPDNRTSGNLVDDYNTLKVGLLASSGLRFWYAPHRRAEIYHLMTTALQCKKNWFQAISIPSPEDQCNDTGQPMVAEPKSISSAAKSSNQAKTTKPETKVAHNISQISCDVPPVWNLLWSWGKPHISWTYLSGWQRVNHFRHARELTRKDLLQRNLARYQCLGGRFASAFSILPDTFVLPKQYLAFAEAYGKLAFNAQGPSASGTWLSVTSNMRNMYQANPETLDHKNSVTEEKSVSNLWILKPVGLSRGRGIKVISSLDQVGHSDAVVAQRYIPNPLLLHGYKFDLRIYVLVTNFSPLEAFVYKRGFARISTKPFTSSVDSVSDRFVHLTNSSIQRYADEQSIPSFLRDANDDEVGGTKCSLQYLWQILSQQQIDTEKIWRSICSLVVKTLVCVDDVIPNQPACFELFGFDILIDDTLRPWLIEVNSSPSLGIDNKIDMMIKSQLIQDTIDLVAPPPIQYNALLEILERRLSNYYNHQTRPHKVSDGQAFGKPTNDAEAVQLEKDLQTIFCNCIPRQYGDLPDRMGDYMRVAPGTTIFNSLMTLKYKVFCRQR